MRMHPPPSLHPSRPHPCLQKAEAEEVSSLIAGARATPSGSKKDTSPSSMCKTYHPKVVEAAWYEW